MHFQRLMVSECSSYFLSSGERNGRSPNHTCFGNYGVVGISFEHIDNYGGEEMGREYWSVYAFHDEAHAVYVEFDGWYDSYNGSEYEEWFFVEPRQVQVTEFSRV